MPNPAPNPVKVARALLAQGGDTRIAQAIAIAALDAATGSAGVADLRADLARTPDLTDATRRYLRRHPASAVRASYWARGDEPLDALGELLRTERSVEVTCTAALAHPGLDEATIRAHATPVTGGRAERVLAEWSRMPADLVATAIRDARVDPDSPRDLTGPLGRGDVATLVAADPDADLTVRLRAAAHPDVDADVVDRLLFHLEAIPEEAKRPRYATLLVDLMDRSPLAPAFAARVSRLLGLTNAVFRPLPPTWFVLDDGTDPAAHCFDLEVEMDRASYLVDLWDRMPTPERTRSRALAALRLSFGDGAIWAAMRDVLGAITEDELVAELITADRRPRLTSWVLEYPRLAATAVCDQNGRVLRHEIDQVVAETDPTQQARIARVLLTDLAAGWVDDPASWRAVGQLPVTSDMLRHLPLAQLAGALTWSVTPAAVKVQIAEALTGLDHPDGDVLAARATAFAMLLADAETGPAEHVLTALAAAVPD